MPKPLPEMLYYNCGLPISILTERRVIPSSRFVGGVSMSAWRDMGSHGPFKIGFRLADWFAQFKPVEYGPHPLKNPMFQDEQEWYSEKPVIFDIDRDVMFVWFMLNAPCVIGPRILAKTRIALRSMGEKGIIAYQEKIVNDPYLEGRKVNHA